jgi:preprotein translocase subunit YajC
MAYQSIPGAPGAPLWLTTNPPATIPTQPATMSSSFMLFQPVAPKAGTPGMTPGMTPGASGGGASGGGASAGTTTQPDTSQPARAGDPQGGAGMWAMMLPLFLVMVVMLFMNRGQRKKDAETRAKLKKGDKVVSQSGIVGELVEMDDRLAKVKIAPGTNVSMLISTIGPYEPVAAKADDRQLKDLKEAKATADKK